MYVSGVRVRLCGALSVICVSQNNGRVKKKPVFFTRKPREVRPPGRTAPTPSAQSSQREAARWQPAAEPLSLSHTHLRHPARTHWGATAC